MDDEETYKTKWIKAEYETMGWAKEAEPEWEFELDRTGTMLIRKGWGILKKLGG